MKISGVVKRLGNKLIPTSKFAEFQPNSKELFALFIVILVPGFCILLMSYNFGKIPEKI